ncbi:hypothetical protein UlMin_006376, partial [Ulmus minor]
APKKTEEKSHVDMDKKDGDKEEDKILMAVNSHPSSDKIEKFPGQPSVSFQQFSGYITVDQKQERALFYYFVEAEKDPHLKPLVLWLNGGPGCSSVGVGAFAEHGPFIPIDGNTLIKNHYSWNKEANMLYLESPAGVGFSYSTDKSFYIGVNDTITARDSLVFLQLWFEKFPEYKNRDFFITGESYAGHYVPQLAKLIIDSKVKFNLKGIAIGNGLLELETDTDSKTLFLWSHGAISEFTLQLLTTVCSYSQIMKVALEQGNLSAPCQIAYNQLYEEQTKFVDVYDVIGNFCISSINNDQSKKLYLNKNSESTYKDCIDKIATYYLNNKEVQKALHARLVGVTEWTTCSKVLKYDNRNGLNPTINVVGSLVKSGLRVLIYSGDQDTAIPFIGSRKLADALAKQLGLKTTVPYKAWFESKQVGGWTQVYGDILTFATIRGASHIAPSTQPARSYLLFKSFIKGLPLPLEP